MILAWRRASQASIGTDGSELESIEEDLRDSPAEALPELEEREVVAE